LKKWSEDENYRSGYYLDSASRVVHARDTDYVIALAVQDYVNKGGAEAQKQMERLFPFICGFDSTDLGAVDMIVKRFKEFPGVFKGIGEVMSRHDDLTNLTTGERPRGNHPSLFRIYDFAGERGIPVSIHHNIAPISPGKKPKEPLYLNELLDAFREFPRTKMILSHAGVSRRIIIEDLPGLLDGVLAKHGSHVYIDLSWVVFEDYILKDLKSWAALIEKHPDNFMIGSDKVGRLATYRREIRKYDALLGAIENPETVAKLAKGNFLRLTPKEGITLPPEYCYSDKRYITRAPPSRDP
ncbi:MAG: amidohydrolase family protein, partial [Planctomycetota bacterium]